MMNNAKIGTAIVGGYLLGRTKKAKLALGLGLFLAGRKLTLDPQAVKKMVADSPVLGALSGQIRDEIIGATKTAATSALTKRVNGFADSLHERTLGLDGADEPVDEEPADDDMADDVAGDPDAADDDGDGDETADAAEGSRRKGTRGGQSAKRKPAKRSESSGGSSGTRRTASRPARPRKTAASGARKTASRGRKTSERGGGDA